MLKKAENYLGMNLVQFLLWALFMFSPAFVCSYLFHRASEFYSLICYFIFSPAVFFIKKNYFLSISDSRTTGNYFLNYFFFYAVGGNFVRYVIPTFATFLNLPESEMFLYFSIVVLAIFVFFISYLGIHDNRNRTQ